MGRFTSIEWCDSTCNVLVGCDGCEVMEAGGCYARDMVARWGGKPNWPRYFLQPTFFLHRMDEALAWPDLTGTPRPKKPWLDGLPRLVFLNDLGDTFFSTDTDWLAKLLPRMADSPHVWILLTKKPERMRQFAIFNPLPANFWIGASVTGPDYLERLDSLLWIPATLHFASLGPLWQGVIIDPWLRYHCVCAGYVGRESLTCGDCGEVVPGPRLPLLDWVIVEGQSGPRPVRPLHPVWVRKIRFACLIAGVPFFFKQWGHYEPIYGPREADPPGCIAMRADGERCDNSGPDAMRFYPAGKDASGRTLDGREWLQMPVWPLSSKSQDPSPKTQLP
jgi:protein gp37